MFKKSIQNIPRLEFCKYTKIHTLYIVWATVCLVYCCCRVSIDIDIPMSRHIIPMLYCFYIQSLILEWGGMGRLNDVSAFLCRASVFYVLNFPKLY